MKAVLVLLALGAAVMAQSFNNIEGFDVLEYGTVANPLRSMPQRVYAGQPFTATITGKYITTGDSVAFTAGNDCRTVVYATTVTASSKTSGTITYSNGAAAQANSGNLRLCYKRVNDDGTNNGWQYYGNLFSLAVTSVDSWTDGYNTQNAVNGAAQTADARAFNMPLRFYKNQRMGGADGVKLKLTGKNLFDGDFAYAITPTSATDGSSCNVASMPSTGNLKAAAEGKEATFSSYFGVPTYSASGATTDNTGYAVGTTVINLASAGTGAIAVNDLITFAGDATVYTVQAGDTNVSNGGSITLTTGLVRAIPAAATAISGSGALPIATGGFAADGLYWVCYSINGASATATSAVTRFDTRLRAVSKDREVTDYHFVFPRVMKSSAAIGAAVTLPAATVRFNILGMRPDDKIAITTTGAKTCKATGASQITLGTGDFSVVNGYLSAKVTLTNNYVTDGANTPVKNTVLNLRLCHYPVGVTADPIDTTTANMGELGWFVYSGDSDTIAENVLLNNEFAAAGGGAFLRGISNTFFYGGFMTPGDAFVGYAPDINGCKTAATTKVTSDWPISTYSPDLTVAGNAIFFCYGAATADAKPATATAITIYDADLTTGGGTKTTFLLPSVFSANSQQWFMSNWNTAGSGTKPGVNWWAGTPVWGNGATGSQDNATVRSEWLLAPVASVPSAVGNGNLCPQFAVQGLGKTTTIGKNGSPDEGIVGTNFRKAALSGSQYGGNLLPNAAVDVGVATVNTLCFRLTDGTKLGSWFSTTLKITQFPELSVWPRKVTAATTGTIKIFTAGAVTGDVIGFEKEANFGATGHCTKTGATLAADGSVTITQATDVLSTAGDTYVTCIKRSPSTNANGFPLRHASQNIAVVAATTGNLGAPSAADEGGKGTTAFYSTSNGITLTWSSSFPDVFDESKTFSISTGTSCTGVVGASGKATVSYKWSWTDAGARAVTANPATVTVGKGAVLGKGTFCHGTDAYDTAKVASPRSFNLKGSCGTTECVAASPKVGASKPFKVINVGDYYPITGTDYAINFDTTNGINTDRIGFVIATSSTAPTATGAITVDAGTLGDAAVAINGKLAAASAAGITAASAGGLYNAWFASAATTTWYKTTSTLTVVKLLGRYPGSVVQSDSTLMYLNQAGFNGKDVYLTTDADCKGTYAVPSATGAPYSAKVNIAPATGTAPATFALAPLPTLTTAADVTWNTFCYRHADQDLTGTGAELPPYVPLSNFVAFIAKKDATLASIDKPVVKSLGTNTNVIVLSEIATTITIGTDGANKGTIDAATPFVGATVADCTAATPVKLGTTTKVTKVPTSWTDSTFTVNVKLTATVIADVGKNTNAICYNIKNSGTVPAADSTDLAAQIEVRPVPAKVGATKPYLLTNIRSGDNQDLDITYATGVTVTLKDTDIICLALPEATGIAQGKLAIDAQGFVALDGTFRAHCAKVATDGTKVSFPSTVASTMIADRDYEVWVSAGAAGGAVAGSAPAKIAGSLIRTLAPAVRPLNVMVTATANTERRILYARSDATADQFHFVSGATTACAGFTGTANPGAAAAGKLTAAFDAAAVYTICYLSNRETTSPKANWLALSTVITVKDASATAGIKDTSAGSIMLPGSALKPASTTDYFIKVHSGVAREINFSFTTSAAQEDDVIRVLAYTATLPTAASCDNQTPTDTPTDSAKNAGAFDLKTGVASVASAINLPALPAAAFNSERLACYRQARVGATPAFKSFPGTTWVRIVTLDAYIIGSSNDVFAPGGAGAVRTATANYQFQVNFWGRWVDIDDFASFVASSSTDCANAWWYENAVYGATAAAVSTTAASSGFSTWFESGLPGGLYSLCYLASNTGTGYNLYSSLQSLRVLSVHIFPAFATPAVSSVFTLTPTTAPGLVNFVAGDRTAIAAASGSNGADCATLASTLTNVTAGPMPSITVTIPANPAVKSYEICASLVGSTGYNKAGAPDSVDPSGNLGADFNSLTSSTDVAARGADADDSPSRYHIRVLYTPTLAYVWPASVVRGMRTDINFFGSYLDGGDQVSFTLVNGTSTPDECAAPAYESMAPNPTPFAQNWALLRGKTFANAGTWNICYKTANATASPAKTSAHGQTVAVVAVNSVAPTSAPATTFAATVATTPLRITLNGFFNTRASASTNPNRDFDHFALIPRNFQTRDCAGINVTVATGFGNRLTPAADGLSAFGFIDTTDAPMAGDYMFCVHFAGSAWSNPINPARDFFLIDPRDATFSLRVAQSFAPMSIVNGTTQTTAAQTIYLSGFGIGVNDTVTTVPSTSTSIADCSDASKAVPADPAKVAAGGAVSFNVPTAGTYRLCWKSSAPGAAFEFIGSNTTLLTVEPATIKTLTTQIGGVPTAVARTVDVADFFQVALTGTGLTGSDSARLVNASIAVSSACEPQGAAATGATPWVKVAAADPLAPSVWWWEIPAGDVSPGVYALCYQWSAGASKVAYPNLNVTVAANPRPLAASPRTVTRLPGTTNFLIWGAGLDRTDSASLVASTANCQALGTATTVSVITAGTATTRALVNVTLATATENTFRLCYFVGGRAPGRDLGLVVVAKEASSCPATQRFFCNGQCVAFAAGSTTSPCSAAPAPICPVGSGTVACPATGYCARSADECSAVATSLAAAGGLPACPAGAIRCFDGSCAANVVACTPIAAPGPGLQRCKDGSVSTNGACLNRDGTAITRTCPGAAAPGYCPAGGCPLNGGSDVKEGCAPFDGCPVGQSRCPDCVCRASCGSALGPFTCSDGKSVPDAKSCACHRFAKVPQQSLDIGTGAVRRRFVVRASVAFTDVNLVNAQGQIIAKVSVDANIALDGGRCALNFMSVAESLIDASIPALTQTTNFIAAPVVMLNLLNGTSACNLDRTKGVTVTFPVTEVTGNMTCAQLFATAAAVAPGPNPNSCRVNGTTIAAAAVTLATFPVVPRAIVAPSAAPSSVPSTVPASATPSPGSAASPVPSSNTTPTDTSSASMSSFSAVLVVLASALLAMLF